MSRRGVATYNICCVFFCLQFFDYELWKISQFAIKRILQSKPNVRYQRLKESSIKASSQYDGRPRGALHLTRVGTLHKAAKHKDRLGSYPCVPASDSEKS